MCLTISNIISQQAVEKVKISVVNSSERRDPLITNNIQSHESCPNKYIFSQFVMLNEVKDQVLSST